MSYWTFLSLGFLLYKTEIIDFSELIWSLNKRMYVKSSAQNHSGDHSVIFDNGDANGGGENNNKDDGGSSGGCDKDVDDGGDNGGDDDDGSGSHDNWM